MTTEQELATALSMQKAAGEIVAILTERMHALGATRAMALDVSGTLISAAWLMQKLWEGDAARASFVAMLRASADKIENRNL